MGALRGPQAPSRRARNVLIDVADLSAAAPATVEVPEFRTFLVESNPTNAVVSVSGEILGKTPYRFVATAQTDDTMVVVSRDGYLPRTWHYRAGAKPPPGQDRVKLVLRRSPRHRDRGSSRRVRWEE
jgi:hypothetical protein